MKFNPYRMYAYGLRRKRYSAAYLNQRRVIFFFFLLSALVSILLPIYFAYMTLQGL